MSEIVLFHHVHGLTDGVRSFADTLRAAGHVVHTPDLFDGRLFDDLTDGMAFARELGDDVLNARADAAVAGLGADLVYAGMSLGVMPAQRFAQQRPGAVGLLSLHAAILPKYFGPWPDGLRAQIHVMDHDEYGDVDDAKQMAADFEGIELFLYPGDTHLFTDRSLRVYDVAATAVLTERVLEFLADR